MKSFRYILMSALALALFACKPQTVVPEEYTPVVDASILDDYPTDLAPLPIGVICKWDDYALVAAEIINIDRFDNIDGSADKDDILDFAGEHFNFVALRDSLQGNLRDTAVAYTCSLLQSRVKFVLIASRELSEAGLRAVQRMLDASGTGVRALGLNDSTDCAAMAAQCYDAVRGERNMALRITQQQIGLKVYPEECTPQQ